MSITQREASGITEFPVPGSPMLHELYCLEKLCFSKRKTSGGMDTKANPLSF